MCLVSPVSGKWMKKTRCYKPSSSVNSASRPEKSGYACLLCLWRFSIVQALIIQGAVNHGNWTFYNSLCYVPVLYYKIIRDRKSTFKSALPHILTRCSVLWGWWPGCSRASGRLPSDSSSARRKTQLNNNVTNSQYCPGWSLSVVPSGSRIHFTFHKIFSNNAQNLPNLLQAAVGYTYVQPACILSNNGSAVAA